MKKSYRSNSLTETEQKEFLSVIDSIEDLALFTLELNSGIRREDITKIRIYDVNLSENSLNFWESKKNRFWIVPLTEEVKRILKMYIDTIPKNRKLLFDFSGRTAYNRLQKYLKKANINKKISFHDLRRSFIKTLIKKKVSEKTICQITGDTFKVIRDYYDNKDINELKNELEGKL